MITEQTLNAVGIQPKEAGSQWQFECPFCGKPDHMYVNKETGAFKCHRCGEAGGWFTLRKQYGEIEGITEPVPKKYEFPTEEYVISCQKKLVGPSGVEAIKYLESRKITPDLIQQFKIGLDKKDGNFVLCIPIIEDGKPVNIKYRSIPPQEKKFTRWKDGKTALFNNDILKGMKEDDPVYITEGEIDAISLCSLGVKAIGVTGGADTIQSEWVDRLNNFNKIYLVYDNDKKGEEGAKKFARRLGYERCFRVKLPTKDANEFIQQGHTKESLQECVNDAEEYGVDNICNITQAFVELTKEYDKKTDATALYPPWENVKKLTGSFEPGDLIIVSAKEKTGKSTWTLNMALNWAKQGYGVLYYCLEMRPARLMRTSLKYVLHKMDHELNPQTMYEGFRRMSGWPIYFGYNYKKVAPDVTFATIREAWKRYGINVVIFDNLHYLVRDIKHQTQEIGYVSQSFKMLAEELEIPVILVAQPKRIGRDDVMGIDDLKDSSSIGADADQVIVLWRKKTQQNNDSISSFEPETLVRVDASRYMPGGETLLNFDGARATFSEIPRQEVKK